MSGQMSPFSPSAMTRFDMSSDGTRLRVLGRYLAIIALANLAWEFAQLPLYTIWSEGTVREIVVAALHCTGLDILIASFSLAITLVLGLSAAWPQRGYLKVATLAIAFGVAFTLVGEWLNTGVLKNWAYSEAMPIVPILNVGLSPLAQWIIIPTVAFWWACRPIARSGQP